MTAIPPGPNLPHEFAGVGGDAPAPGSTRRFVITLVVAAAVLVGVVVGMIAWMEATSSHAYRGPERLKEPDHPYYR